MSVPCSSVYTPFPLQCGQMSSTHTMLVRFSTGMLGWTHSATDVLQQDMLVVCDPRSRHKACQAGGSRRWHSGCFGVDSHMAGQPYKASGVQCPRGGQHCCLLQHSASPTPIAEPHSHGTSPGLQWLLVNAVVRASAPGRHIYRKLVYNRPCLPRMHTT